MTYDKSNPLTDTLEFIWKVTNVPEKGMNDVVIETERIQLYSYSGAVGGFTWSGELPAGDSTGIYKADISKQSAEGAGLYRARVKVRNCSFEKVNYCDDAHAIFKVSKWVTYSIIDSRSSENEQSPLVELRTNGISTDTFQTSPYTNLDFTIHPSVGSKISNCSVNKTYTDSTRSEILKFNKIITADNYGKTSALAVTDLGALQNVSVSCRLNSKTTLSDSVQFDVMQSPLKKKTELFMNNRSIGDFIDSTEIAMLKFCRDTMRILEAGSEKGLFQCYWGGESVIEAKVGYKG